MPAPSPAPDHIAHRSSALRPMLCPFHDGAATLDLLLAELDPRDTLVFDAVLDLRSLCLSRSDAAACVHQLFRVRALLKGRHHLAFYRVRCWARRAFRIQVRCTRAADWMTCEFPLNAGRIDEVTNAALSALAQDGTIPALAHVRFVYAA